MRVGLIRFLQGFFGELLFWLFAVIALLLIGALATFHAADPAWTHTARVDQIRNFGGVAGAWFADVSLYFFGYPAYLLPLGLLWAGWRLFKRGALLRLDAEIVLYRVLGFAVALATACGLAALYITAAPTAMPGAGSAGGLVGIYVGRFLVEAFGYPWGQLLMAGLLLAGVTLATGFSWLRLLDWVGGAVLKTVGSFGSQPKPPPGGRGRRPSDAEAKKANSPADSRSTDTGNKPLSRKATPPRSSGRARVSDQSRPEGKAPIDQRSLAGGLRERVTNSWVRWQEYHARLAAAVSSAPVAADEPTPALSGPPMTEATLLPAALETSSAPIATAGSRYSGRIEPVFHLHQAEPPRVTGESPPGWPSPAPTATKFASDPAKPIRSDLTLLPTALISAKPANQPPPILAPTASHKPTLLAPAVEARWSVEDEEFPIQASNDSISSVQQAPPPSARAVATPTAPTLAGMTPAIPTFAPAGALPPLDLLDQAPARTSGYSSAALEDMSRQVEALLKSFGIEARVVAVEPGPVITRFEVDPAPGVKVSQISNLAKDLARGLSVISVRVVEVIPGKSVIGLEIPNRQRQIVYLREVLEAPIYTQSASPLTLALGMDIGGNPVVANLAKMPHLLVAGTTGSGKSVAINAMLLSLLYKARPAEARLILVDPKMLELSMYEDIPHLLTPVVTDMKEAANALRWCVGEMERRYRLMAALKVRNIAGFNRKVEDALAEGVGLLDPLWKPDGASAFDEPPILQPLPFIVVVIDELADMMMIVGKKVEELIARLAQKARAAGIHLILATQRPSVDVITGLIKANIPTRIAFQVSSKVDSRTILDQMGAEQLLGHGDMLYLPPGTGLPQRVHGAFVDDQEVNRVVDYLRQTGSPDYIDDVLVEPREEGEFAEEGENGSRGGESDPLYDEAVKIVTESRRASVSGVQRRLRIGYNRAARLVEEMEVAGVVGPLQSNGSREVLAPPPP